MRVWAKRLMIPLEGKRFSGSSAGIFRTYQPRNRCPTSPPVDPPPVFVDSAVRRRSGTLLVSLFKSHVPRAKLGFEFDPRDICVDRSFASYTRSLSRPGSKRASPIVHFPFQSRVSRKPKSNRILRYPSPVTPRVPRTGLNPLPALDYAHNRDPIKFPRGASTWRTSLSLFATIHQPANPSPAPTTAAHRCIRHSGTNRQPEIGAQDRSPKLGARRTTYRVRLKHRTGGFASSSRHSLLHLTRARVSLRRRAVPFPLSGLRSPRVRLLPCHPPSRFPLPPRAGRPGRIGAARWKWKMGVHEHPRWGGCWWRG